MNQASPSFDPIPVLAKEIQLTPEAVAAVVQLIDAGGTVPFIARYRKEATGGLDEVQIRAIQERRTYLLELEQRRKAILESIAEQGKLGEELRLRIVSCPTKAELEDLYLPFRPKRRTRATVARERGLEPLAEQILLQPEVGDPQTAAAPLVDQERGVPDVEAALAGARDIVAERLAEDADVRRAARERLAREGMLAAEVHPDKAGERTKYEQYYGFSEKVAEIPSHRYLALRRGEREKVLRVKLEVVAAPLIARIEAKAGLQPSSPFAGQLRLAVADAYARLLAPSVETDIRLELKQRSDGAAIEIFASNLRNLLLAPPLGNRSVVGIDPGLRTGSKCVAVDHTGKYLESITLYLSKGESAAARARQQLLDFLGRHTPFAVAIGNGTGSRETEDFVRPVLLEHGFEKVVVVQVNEAGASVYSASEIAREEFPQLDVTIRGAISIARRLQDPLAELVKIEPKAIGVGQYQHDVNQHLLQRKLEEVVEDCVNQVGVELNTASAPLLAQVAGIGPQLARKIVAFREEQGAFVSRQQLLKVPSLGPRTFEQAAGFLRIRGGAQPLDASAVHPERYALVERIARDLAVELTALVGSTELVARIEPSNYIGGDVGEPTLIDILEELRKPGRDPRTTFEAPCFEKDIATLEDLRPGLELKGVVTNVTAFGAFVDIGVHQDGLVHVSKLSERFVRDPHEVAQVGQRLTVWVLDVDLERRRISLSARPPGSVGARRGGASAKEAAGEQENRRGPAQGAGPDKGRGRRGGKSPRGPAQRPAKEEKQAPRFSNTPFADLLKR